MNRIKLITPEQANIIVLVWEKDNKKNNNLYLADTGDRYIAIDNMSGECWVEEFETIHSAIDWLLER